MRIVTTLILALILAAVFVLIYFFGEDRETAPEGKQPLLPGFVRNAVERIELTLYLKRKILLERRGGGRWEILEPFQDDARVEQINQLLDIMESNTRVAVPLKPEERDLPSKGLGPPEHYLKYQDGRGTHTLFIGRRDPFKSETYVMMEGDDALYLTGSNLLNVLQLNPENLRDDRLFKIESRLVNEVIVSSTEGTVLHAYQRAGSWQILAPIKADAESSRLQNLVNRLCGLEVESRSYTGEITEAVMREVGLTGPVLNISLVAGSLSRKVVIQGLDEGTGPGGDFFCRRDDEDVIVTVSAPEWLRIGSRLHFNYYRSRVLLKPVREQLQDLKIWKDEELHLALERIPNTPYFNITHPFKAQGNNLKDGGTSPIYMFLVKVDGIRIDEAGGFVADDVTNLSDFGLDPPAMRLELMWKEGGSRRKASLAFSRPTGTGRIYAVRMDRPGSFSVYSVKPESLEPLNKEPILLRDPRIFPQDVGAIQEACFFVKERQFAIKRNEQGFFQKDPDNRFQQFLHDMVRIKVVRFLAEPLNMEDPRFASMEGAVDLKIQEEGKNARELRIEIGAQSTDGWYGRMSDLPQGLFILPENFMEEFAKRFKDLPD